MDNYIGRNIKLLRVKAGYTQEAQAGELDVSLGMISRLENGNSMVSIDHVLKIARILRGNPGDNLNEPLEEE